MIRISPLFAAIFVFVIFSCGLSKDESQASKNNSFDSEQHPVKNNNTTATPILFLKNGINYIDLNGDNIKDMVISGFRNNISAHSFNYYTFYIFQKNLSDDNLPWGIVEIDGQEKEEYNISSHQGADGILSDIAFVKNNIGKYELVKADRDFGNSFADSGRVKFNYYSLKYDSLENRYHYEVVSDKFSKFKYVDVHEAITRELIGN